MKTPKVAIVHDSLTQHGGGEKVVEAILDIFPDAPVYTSVYNPAAMGESFKSRAKKIITGTIGLNSTFGKFPILTKYFTFLLPLAFENFDLSEYDIIISSSSSYAKGVITRPDQLHIGYIHTPPRFLYGCSVESTKRNAWYYKPVVMLVDHYLKVWDYLAAQRADFLVANSQNVQKRIKKFYRRDSTVIHPPVETDFADRVYAKDSMQQPYYIAIGRFSDYKNFDLIIQAFNLLGIPLKIIGTGVEEAKLRKMAKSNIEFVGRVSDEEKHRLWHNSLGYIFAGEDEDFGIVLVESLSHGIPVLAHRSGGPREIIREGKDGMFFDSLNLESFVEKLKEFDQKVRGKKFDTEGSKKHAQKFSKEVFKKAFEKFVMERWGEKQKPTLLPLNDA